MSAFVAEFEHQNLRIQGFSAAGEETWFAVPEMNLAFDIGRAPPEVVIDVHCSSGTYVRSLANDLGVKLGCGAYLVGLRRTKSGRFSLRDATPLRKLQEAFTAGNWYQYLIPAAEALGDWPAVELNPDEVEGVRHGHRVKAKEGDTDQQKVRGVSTQGELVALMEAVEGEDGKPAWQPKKVFFTSE